MLPKLAGIFKNHTRREAFALSQGCDVTAMVYLSNREPITTQSFLEHSQLSSLVL